MTKLTIDQREAVMTFHSSGMGLLGAIITLFPEMTPVDGTRLVSLR